MYKEEVPMLFNYLNPMEKRTIQTCNFNLHIGSRHPNRIMEVHDLVWIREGTWQISQDGEDYTVSAGDVILLQAGHHHYGNVSCESPVKTRYIHFSRHADDFLGEEKEAPDGFYTFPTVVHCGADSGTGKQFEQVIRAFWAEEPYEKAKAPAYLDLLLCEISRIGVQKRSMADEIKELIRKTPHRFIPNEEFADEFGCSGRTVSSKFRESTGTSLHAWQMQMKCRMAEELMQSEPTITLREVAATYGFCDEYHFGKCFKKVMGRSPKRFR